MVRSVGLRVNHELESGQHHLYRWGMFVDVLSTMVFCVEISREREMFSEVPTCTPRGIHGHKVNS